VVDHAEWLRANQLTEAAYLNLLAQRALTDWLSQKSPAAFHLQHSILVDWAEQNGVSLPLEFLTEGATEQTLENWIIEKGPDYFGLNWNFDTVLLEELQVTGRAAELTGQLEAAA
jgi:hypothetical protein